MENQNQNQNQNEMEFDLLQLFGHLLKRAWIIVLVMVVFAVAAYGISKKNEVPRYTASCRVFVYSQEDGIGYNDALYALYLRKDCQVILTGQNVAAEIVNNLGLNISPSAISGGIRVAAEDDTHVLELSYTDTNPKRAAAILNELCEVGGKEVQRHMEKTSFTVMYYADVPTAPTAGTATRDTVLGAAVGMVLAAAVLVVLYLLDDTIRSEDDVERYLGLSTLTAITLSPDLASDSKAAEEARKKVPPIRRRKN
jgi:capsular polysaccharide biosynthesis protein